MAVVPVMETPPAEGKGTALPERRENRRASNSSGLRVDLIGLRRSCKSNLVRIAMHNGLEASRLNGPRRRRDCGGLAIAPHGVGKDGHRHPRQKKANRHDHKASIIVKPEFECRFTVGPIPA